MQGAGVPLEALPHLRLLRARTSKCPPLDGHTQTHRRIIGVVYMSEAHVWALRTDRQTYRRRDR